MQMQDFTGLLVKVRGDGNAFATAMAAAFGATSVKIEPILRVPPQPGDSTMGLAASPAMTWMSLGRSAASTDHPWDAAHALLGTGTPFAAADGTIVEATEPNLIQGWFDGAPQ